MENPILPPNPQEDQPAPAGEQPAPPQAAPLTQLAVASQPPPAAGPALEWPEPEKVKSPSLFYRFLNWLLGKDSRMGRFMRRLLVTLATITGLLALGLLAGYFWLYQPTQAKLDSAYSDIRKGETTIQSLQEQVKTSQAALDLASKQTKTLNDDLKTAQNRNNLLVVIHNVATARMYLALKDGAKTITALEQAQAGLAVAFPFLAEKNKSAADEIKGRLDLLPNVVRRDAVLAQSDLDNLYTALLAIQEGLFGAASR